MIGLRKELVGKSPLTLLVLFQKYFETAHYYYGHPKECLIGNLFFFLTGEGFGEISDSLSSKFLDDVFDFENVVGLDANEIMFRFNASPKKLGKFENSWSFLIGKNNIRRGVSKKTAQKVLQSIINKYGEYEKSQINSNK